MNRRLILGIVALAVMATAACSGSDPTATSVPTATIAPTPTNTPAPTPTPSPTATPVPATAVPTTTSGSTDNDALKQLRWEYYLGSVLSSMVLTQGDIDTEFPSLLLEIDTSGTTDNHAAAENTIDPEDTGEDLADGGRLTGYNSNYFDLSSFFGGSFTEPVAAASAVDQFTDASAARKFLQERLEEADKFAGVALEGGTFTSVEHFAPPALGEFAGAFKAVLDVPQLGIEASLYQIGWQRGELVVSFGLMGPVGLDNFPAALRLARVMDGRVEEALAGSMGITQLPTATPMIVSNDEAETKAMQQGFDLREMIAMDESFPGFESPTETLFTDAGAISANRSLAAFPAALTVGGSTAIGANFSATLYGTPFEAQAPLTIMQGLPPETLSELFSQGIGQVEVPEDAPLGSVGVAALDTANLGDSSLGFEITFEQVPQLSTMHMIMFVRGQVAATVTMFGTEILLEDSLSIARDLDARVQTFSP